MCREHLCSFETHPDGTDRPRHAGWLDGVRRSSAEAIGSDPQGSQLQTMTRCTRRWLIAIIALSILLRMAVAFYLGDVAKAPPHLVDQVSYHTLATRLLTGHGFSFDRSWYPFTAADTPTAHWSFLYPLYLAAVYSLFGVHPLAARLVGAVLGGILLPLAVYRWARRLLPEQERVARVAAACAAVYFYFILYAATLMTETFYICALVWSMERALVLAGRPTLRRGVVLGLSLGIATLLRQSILPWVLVLAVWLLWVGWRSKRLLGTLAAGAAAGVVLTLCLLPFTIRNYRVYGRFLLLNSNAGYAMYSAQHPMHGTNFKEFEAAPLPEDLVGQELNEAQWDTELMRRGIGFVLAEPGRYLVLSLSRLPDYFEFWPTADTTLLHNIGRVGSFGLFLPFMLAGLVLALRRRGPRCSRASWAAFSVTPLALALLFIIFYPLLHILTWAMSRYRLPVDAVVLPFAALVLLQAARFGRGLLSRARPVLVAPPSESREQIR
jgi:4-amino-4-deoxy-L-arabinose transferase-like glycosyltransferase